MAEHPFVPYSIYSNEEDGRRVVRYDVLRKLGEGGMAKVLLAADLQASKLVAIKLPKNELYKHREIILRFRLETDVLSRLNHPRIVQFVDWGVDDDRREIFYVMEYFDGGELSDLIDACVEENEGKPINGSLLTFADIQDIALQTLEALHAIHSEGFVHRDLKPSNILWRREMDGGLSVKVTDFGIAKIMERCSSETLAKRPPLTQDGSLMGTLVYMSPEQARQQPVDERSDLFTLGNIVYEMVTGKSTMEGIPDYYAAVLGCLIKNERFEESRYPSKLVENMNPALEQWILKLLEYDPDKRFQTALEAAREFRQTVVFRQETPLDTQKPKPTHMSLRPAAHPSKQTGVKRGKSLIAFAAACTLMAMAVSFYFLKDEIAVGGAATQTAIVAQAPEANVKPAVPKPTASASAKPPSSITISDLPEPDRVRFQRVVKQMKALRPKMPCPRDVKRGLLYFDATYLSFSDVKYWIMICFDREGQAENAELFREQYRALHGGLDPPP